MIASGSRSTRSFYHRLLPYQPGWAALPLGLLELGLTMPLARALGLECAAAARRSLLLRRHLARSRSSSPTRRFLCSGLT